MPETKVRAPDGRIITVRHPEGATQQEIIAYAQSSGQVAQSQSAEAVQPPSPYKGPIDETIGLAEKGLHIGSATLAAPVSGLAGIFAGLIPGGMEGADAVRSVGNAITYDPKTEVGQRPTFIGNAMRWIEQKADTLGEISGDPEDVLGATAVKTAILGAPALFGGRNAIRNVVGDIAHGRILPTSAKPATLPTAPDDAMGLSAETVTGAGDRLVNNTFRTFRQKVGDSTQVPMTNTLQAARAALEELAQQGKSQSSIARELRAIVGRNSENPQSSVAILDDIAGNMIRAKVNPKGTGPRQAQQVLDAVIKDMDVAGKSIGVSFADDIATARAFGDLYRSRSNLGRVIGQHGERLAQYQRNNPAAYQEIVRDWTTKQVESFVKTTVTGGRGFNTGGFGQWVARNENYLNKIVGPETVSVWKAFPKWEGRASMLRGIGQRFVEAKTGGLSRFFNKEIDTRFAEGMAEQLTNPDSALFRALSEGGSRGTPATPTLALQGALAEEARDGEE